MDCPSGSSSSAVRSRRAICSNSATHSNGPRAHAVRRRAHRRCRPIRFAQPGGSTGPRRGRSILPTPPTLNAAFRQPSANVLSYDVTIQGVSAQDVLLLAIHRTSPPAPAGSGPPPNPAGYLIARLLRTGEIIGRGEITLRDADREDLAAGRLSHPALHPTAAVRTRAPVDCHRALSTERRAKGLCPFSAVALTSPTLCSSTVTYRL